MKNTILTRQELYDLVWKESLTALSLKYAYSYDGLKKLCKTNNIPTPPNGYWSKLKFNKPVSIIKLPVDIAVNQSFDLIYREKDSKISYDQSPLTILTKQIESNSKAPLIVPEKLSKPDILIQNTKFIHDKRKKERYYRNDRLDYVSINVDETNWDRALRIMDTFIKLIRYRGHSFKRDRNNWGPKIAIRDIEFPFHIREVQKRIPPVKEYDTSTYIPTGVLLIKIGESFKAIEWKDGNVKLENQLAKIMAKLELEADEEVAWKEECRLHAIQRAEEKKIEQEFKARKEKEIIKTKKLFSDAEKFDKATIYRNFINATAQKAIQENRLTDELKDWIKWANEKADWFDPFINREDELLNDKDREEFHKPKQTNNYYR